MSASSLPVSEKPVANKSSGLHPAFYVGSWIFFSNLTILFNKWLLDSAGFKYPVILTCWHMLFATAATQLLARFTTLLDGRKDVEMTGRLYLRAIVPIGLLYSASLVCSNLTYLYLSVAFIQMLKAGAPVAVLFASWAWGVADPSLKVFLNILAIVFGVGLASFGEIEFSWVGFLYQMGGIVFEAVRLVMIQVLLSGETKKMDPLVSLYYYAPVCAVTNVVVAFFWEWSTFQVEDLVSVGWVMLFANASVAFMLNIASVFLIGKTSGLVMTLCGILKNILLVIISVMIWHTAVSWLQVFGYAIATAGLIYYSLGWEQIKTQSALAYNYVQALADSPDESRFPAAYRRLAFMGLAALIIVLLYLGFNSGSSESASSLTHSIARGLSN